jgi:SAM-dependent methyltransferase
MFGVLSVKVGIVESGRVALPSNIEDLQNDEYRAHVGPSGLYDIFSAVQFNLLTALGLRDNLFLLDIGCGSLRAGRLFIPYLRPGHYFGIEPLPWLVQEGIDNEIGEEMVRIKRPTISHDDNFTLSLFGRTFDFLIAQSIFSHTSEQQLRRCLSETKNVLAPGGILAATFFPGKESYKGDHWVARAEYTIEHMRHMVKDAGLECTLIDWPHPDVQQWILIHHPNAAIRLPVVSSAEQQLHLQEQLDSCRQQLFAIRNHPYIKFGIKFRFIFVWLGFVWRGFLRSASSVFRKSD